MSDIEENKQIPKIFYDELDKPEPLSNFRSSNAYRTIIVWGINSDMEEILAKLLRNVRIIKSKYSGNHKKRCRDVNHWFKGKIKSYEPSKKKDISDHATAVFNEVKWNTLYNNIVCKNDQEHPYEDDHDEIMKKLDDYCEIRDNIQCSVLINEAECLKYNKYIMKKKEELTSEMQRICRGDNYCKLKDYTIGNNCTFNNVDNTFSKINCEGLYKTEKLKKTYDTIKERSPLEIGFFIIVSFILFYLFILFLEKFTPVGSIIHRFRRRKYNLKRNIERVDDDDRYSLYHSDKMSADSENKRYLIDYARTHN
ncbi:VIR protein [Plasmodium vivax]|uniref:VIR protein n=1 Tax=Plasmodium vivax TaxID=5855 RepID=A0A1G4E8L7_PLAVI|nr:VIR protein [Plasmodium vivax]